MIKSEEHKIAQKFVVLAYLRYRMNRKNYQSILKSAYAKDDVINIQYFSIENESWNHLQSAKQIYYQIIL